MSIHKIADALLGSMESKKRWRQYKARMKQLPPSYRTTAEGLERYLMYAGGMSDGDALVALCEDVVDLLEQSAASGTPVRSVVGDDPVLFADELIRNYAGGQWVNKERRRLIDAIDQAAEQESEAESEPEGASGNEPDGPAR